MAELYGVFEALKLSREKGYTKVKLQVDSQEVSNALKGRNLRLGSSWGMLKRIKSLIRQDWEIRISHIYQETNACANVMAKLGLNLGIDICYFFICPTYLALYLYLDMFGAYNLLVTSV